jgi:hypothetical protein
MSAKNKVVQLIMALVVATLLPLSQGRGATLDSHTVVLDSDSRIIPWTTDPASGYDQVMGLAWNYLLTVVPSDSSNGKPYYYSYSYLDPDSQQPEGWAHNPAGLYSMLTESALKYYGYSGNIQVIGLATAVATAQLDNGMTPAGWHWANVPYASSDPGSLTYGGAAAGDSYGSGDGVGVIEPDKVGEMGNAWLQLYQFSGSTRFRDAAIAAADALASHVRTGTASQSPWPFRVYAQTGVVREEYCADVIAPITLFDGLIRLGLGNTAVYQSARQTAWSWLMTYPMQNNIWANYFEDIRIQPDTSNVNQYNAMMTARYLLEHPEYDPEWQSHVRGLLSWVENTFGEPAFGATTIAEQIQFAFPMGSHTARYASVNALLFERTGDLAAKEKAYRALNWATYMARTNGVVIDGPEVGNQWFTDGYGDYIRHFMTSLGAVPEWSPPGQNHLLRSTSVVQQIAYGPTGISYVTSDGAATEVLRTQFVPVTVTVDGQPLGQRADLEQPGWTYDGGTKTLRIRHDSGNQIQITAGTLTALAVTPQNQNLTVGTTRQYFATGTYSDGSSQNLTPQVVWLSSNPAVAIVSSTGLVTALAPGSSTISATLEGFSDSTQLTVQQSPLSIITATLPDGILNNPYNATLAASGGTPPYSWQVTGGQLPGGLSLASSGVLSGSPTAAGTFTFTVQAGDSSTPPLTASRDLTLLVVAPAEYTLWPVGTVPLIGDSGPDSAVELGVKFRSDTAGYISGIRFYKATANSGIHVGNLWTTGGTRLATATFTNESASGWQQVTFPNPVAIAANTVYVASYHTSSGHYSCDQNYFATRGVDRPPLHAPANGVTGVNGVYAYGSTSRFPSSGWRSANYWVDVLFTTVTIPDTVRPIINSFALPATATSLTVAITSFTASDNVAVTGYLVTESSTPPGSGWGAAPQNSYTFATSGSKTLYAWARDAAGNVSLAVTAGVTITIDTTPPAPPANLSATAGGPTQVSLNWSAATDNVAVTGYRVMRNSSQIATSSATAYTDATVAPGTTYSYTVRAYDDAGNVSTDSNSATVTTPAPLPAPLVDVAVTTKQSSGSRTISSPSFSTSGPDQLLLAFIASDGPNAGGAQRITAVTGGGLTWTMRVRANGQAGTAEIWQARSTAILTNVTVTATRYSGSYQGMITVAAFRGANMSVNGASASASAPSGAPLVSLVTTRANSVVWGVGDDWDRAVARTVSTNQTKQSEFLAPAGDTFWVQYLTAPVAASGVTATISCTAPSNDRWNLAAIEIVAQ